MIEDIIDEEDLDKLLEKGFEKLKKNYVMNE